MRVAELSILLLLLYGGVVVGGNWGFITAFFLVVFIISKIFLFKDFNFVNSSLRYILFRAKHFLKIFARE
jgi:hypothetical protein